jgi:hypothetical protein
MGFEDDLRRAEEHVAEARRLVHRQKGLIIRLSAAGVSTLDAQRIVWLLESNLRRFEEYSTETVSKKAQNSSPVFGGSHLTELSGSLAQELPVAATLELASEDRVSLRLYSSFRPHVSFVPYTMV